MSRPDGVTGYESDEIGQKMCFGNAVLSKQDCLTRYVEQSYLQIIIWEESHQKKMRIILRKLLQVFRITTDTEQSKVFVSICISPWNDSSVFLQLVEFRKLHLHVLIKFALFKFSTIFSLPSPFFTLNSTVSPLLLTGPSNIINIIIASIITPRTILSITLIFFLLFFLI